MLKTSLFIKTKGRKCCVIFCVLANKACLEISGQSKVLVNHKNQTMVVHIFNLSTQEVEIGSDKVDSTSALLD